MSLELSGDLPFQDFSQKREIRNGPEISIDDMVLALVLQEQDHQRLFKLRGHYPCSQ